MRLALLVMAGVVMLGCSAGDMHPGAHPSTGVIAAADFAGLEEYAKDGQLTPPADGKASLYLTPWRSNVRTASAHKALAGFGVYYKHVPAWNIEESTAFMKQMKAAGVQRLRIAPHLSLLMVQTPEATVDERAVKGLVSELTGCFNAGIRPTVTFVHIPPMSGGDELAAQWAAASYIKTLMPWGKPGDDTYKAYFEKVYAGFKIVLDAAREAGFTKPGSYDLELGQNLYWGFPAQPPFPGLTMADLESGGIVWNFQKELLERAAKEGYKEATVLWGQSHHRFDALLRQRLDSMAGWSISFYGTNLGVPGTETFIDNSKWPARDRLTFAEGTPPAVNLMKPEGWMADFSRRDNLIAFIKAAGDKRVAITSLGVVPSDDPRLWIETVNDAGGKTYAKAAGVDGWEIKTRSIVRTLGFWMNQGADQVLVHSAYEGKTDEMTHALIPFVEKPEDFRWENSRPLTAMHRLATAFDGAKPIADKNIKPLSFRYALAKDSVLIPTIQEDGKPLTASDAMTILPFQIDSKKYAVMVYVQTPDITKRLEPVTMTLSIDKVVKGDVKLIVPSNAAADGKAQVSQAKDNFTLVTFPVSDEATVLVFDVK
ncbi:MAG: hypothetical protein FWE88_08545 [Phycisphaerae bacterium]|nr:hypothetical protein [Phycisphaerae bacterium]